MVDHVNGVNGMGGMQPVRRLKLPYRFTEPIPASDSVELSSDVMRLKGVEGFRVEKVMAIRSEIEAGTYFTADKFDKAMDAALDQLFGAR